MNTRFTLVETMLAAGFVALLSAAVAVGDATSYAPTAVGPAVVPAADVAPTEVLVQSMPPLTVPQPDTGVADGVSALLSFGPVVRAAASANFDAVFYGETIVRITNAAPLTAMTATISVAQSEGISFHGHYNDFAAGSVTMSNTSANGYVTFTFTLRPGRTIPAGAWTIDAQVDVAGRPHSPAGDTWRIVSTAGGVESSISGGF